MAVFAGVMAYQATHAEKRAVASEKYAKNALSDAQLTEAERLVDENFGGDNIIDLALEALQSKRNDPVNYIVNMPEFKIDTNIDATELLRKVNKSVFISPNLIVNKSKHQIDVLTCAYIYFLHPFGDISNDCLGDQEVCREANGYQ